MQSCQKPAFPWPLGPPAWAYLDDAVDAEQVVRHDGQYHSKHQDPTIVMGRVPAAGGGVTVVHRTERGLSAQRRLDVQRSDGRQWMSVRSKLV